jgi:hypothetical protein
MLNFHLLANYIKYLTIALKVTNGVFAPLIDNKIKRKNNKKEEDIRNIEN